MHKSKHLSFCQSCLNARAYSIINRRELRILNRFFFCSNNVWNKCGCIFFALISQCSSISVRVPNSKYCSNSSRTTNWRQYFAAIREQHPAHQYSLRVIIMPACIRLILFYLSMRCRQLRLILRYVFYAYLSVCSCIWLRQRRRGKCHRSSKQQQQAKSTFFLYPFFSIFLLFISMLLDMSESRVTRQNRRSMHMQACVKYSIDRVKDDNTVEKM